MKKSISLILLHLLLLVYSISGILTKSASAEQFLSLKFCLFYGGLLFILAIYAVCWQQIIKTIPLSTAFANKAITVVWGIAWSALFFGDRISIGKIVGAAFVIAGIVLFAFSDRPDNIETGGKNECGAC